MKYQLKVKITDHLNNIKRNVIGLSPEEKLHGVKYIIESFVGCIKEMVLSAGKAASDLLPIKPLIATKHDNVQEGCIDKYDVFVFNVLTKKFIAG